MAAASCLLTEDQFLCSICLDVFTDPVTSPCGHNYCKSCITTYWNINVQCQCPVCKRIYHTRPELQVNTFISEMAAQFRQSAQHKAMLDHKTQDALKERTKGKKSELVKTDAEIQQMIKKRRVKIEEIRRSVELSNKAADREMEEGVQVFTALKETVERSQAELIKTITEKQRVKVNQGAVLIKQLEQEISALEKQTVPSVGTSPATRNWTGARFLPASYEGSVVRAVSQLEKELSDYMTRLFQDELRRVQKYAVNVTLDPDVVHPKRDKHADNRNICRCVLSKQGFSSGRFYFAVTTSSTFTVGVTTQLTDNSSEITLSPRNGYWTLSMQWKLIGPNKYFAAADQPVCLSLKSKPTKVGVFVDHEQGLVSFHDVTTAALIFCFTGCCFPGTVYPFFSPCDNNGMKIHTKDESCVLQ
ncbi:E3 ubiquitin-protein ligase TRIM38-like [Betta splendens]|uniref:E3 ubiquitin-protein ligase TRIM38-like n=1 Tax=Betta splendens TaxID=158456 RepID=A0A6P7MUQ2_BETSP|nr:E3 ubiquitin-protein ligase TRIM38-like [Betta splendens]